MTGRVYDFEGDSYRSIRASKYDDLPRLSFRDRLTHTQKAILELISGPQKSKFANRGYVLIVNGPWGAGKTTATWAMLNEICSTVTLQDLPEPVVIDRSFLPFGSVSESITTFLQELSHELWSKGVVDVRKEMEQFILEATPAPELTASLAVGPMSITRSVKLASNDVTHDVMVEKFRKLATKCQTVVLVIDDLDRLRPDEIVQVMRLVEKLRALPRVLVVLPLYKQVVTEAFHSNLVLSASAASTFMRKLTDIEVKLENILPDVSTAFCELFTAEIKQEFEPALQPYGVPIDAFCWFMLMHNMILAEAVASAPGMDAPAKLFDGTHSQYIHLLQQLFFAHGRINSAPYKAVAAPYPAHYLDNNGNEIFAPLGRHYGDIAENQGNEPSIRQLSDNRNLQNVMKLVTKDPILDNELWDRAWAAFDPAREQASSAPVMIEVFVPLLRTSTNEPLITDHYKLRDVRNLARKIIGHEYFRGDRPSVISDVYFAVKDSFDSFRF